MVSEEEISLLPLFPLIQRLVFSELDRREFPYTKTQLLILVALKRCGSLCMTQIAGFISSSKEQATRAVAPLADQGLVERYTDPGNRKMVYIRLSDVGADYVGRLTDRYQEKLREHIRSKLDEKEIRQLRSAVRTAYELLSRL